MKRFWDHATLAEVPGGQSVLLDGRPMRLPGSGTALVLPNPAMAEAIAAEWQNAGAEKGGELAMQQLPLTRLAATAQDRIAPDPGPTAAAIAAYAETDLLCYRAERPAQLVLRQSHRWQPWLDWARRTHGARLRIGAGLLHVPQDPDDLAALHRVVAACDAWTLAGLGVAVPSLGSLVLGLALAAGALGPDEAHDLSELDAAFQAEQWGADAEAQQRDAAMLTDVRDAAQFMILARG